MKYLYKKNSTLISLCREKLHLYRSLSDILYNEKKAIVKADINKLWDYSAEKQQRIDAIMQIRKSLFDLIRDSNNDSPIDEDSKTLSKAMMEFIQEDNAGKKDLSAIISDIRIEKKKIRSIGAQNISFIHEYLDSVEDIMGLITGQDKQTIYDGYGRTDSNRAYAKQRLYSREV